MTQSRANEMLYKEGGEPPLSATGLKQRIQEKEEYIRELETLLKTISQGKYMWESTFDVITNPVMIVSSDFTIQRANVAAAEAAGMDVRRMIGAKCYENLAGASEPCAGCPLNSTLATHESHFNTLDPFRKNKRRYQVNAYPLNPHSNDNQVVMNYRDITEETELQRQLLHSEKMAAIGVLAGGVAHEINNPLGGILAFAQLIMRDLPKEHACQADLKEIEDAALRCKRIIQDLLDFSRQSKEESQGPVQLNDVITKILPLAQVQTRSSKIQVTCELDQALPPITGNVHKLQQVGLNLFTNAYQAMKNGGELKLKTYYRPKEGKVYWEVSDTGLGISPEHIDKIFDPYFTTKEQGEGTGLGLSISYGIVQEYKGEIKVKSEKGVGSTFIVSFPKS